MICELFEYLPPKDLAACSMVNKRWHSIYAAFKLHRLVATNNSYFIKWYDSDQQIPESELCRPAMFGSLAEKPLLSNLKHLALVGRFFYPRFDLNKLNRFRQLVHLEIDIPLDGRIRLNLPKLRVLAFYSWNYVCSVSIDCPLLSTLLYTGEDSDLLKMEQPETIRKLQTNMVGAELAAFKRSSVECLVTSQQEAISKATLQTLPRLRELRYNSNIEWVFNKPLHEAVTVDQIKRTLSEFLDEAKKLRGNDFRLRYSGFQLTNVNVDQIDFGVQIDETGRERVSAEYVYMKNYQLIERGALDFVRCVDYTRLLHHVAGEFPRCFSEKFTDIDCIKATAEVQDVDQFLWFLKSLRFLRKLELADTSFSQEFYDQLPASAHSLNSLKLEDGHCENKLQLNFDFIGKLCLSDLNIYSPVPLESLPSLFRSLGKLVGGLFIVQLREERFWVSKTCQTIWNVRKTGGKHLFVTENPDEIVSYFNDLQTDTL